MIYTDGVHIVCDSKDLTELHLFANKVGLRKHWFEGMAKKHPHYDFPGHVKDYIIETLETKMITSREIVTMLARIWKSKEEEPVEEIIEDESI